MISSGISRTIRSCTLLAFLALILSPATADDENTARKNISLEESIRSALESDREIRYAGYNIRMEKEKLKVSLRKFFPSLSIGLTQNDSVTYGSPDTRSKQFSVGLSQLLFDAGRTMRAYDNQEKQTRLGSLAIALQQEQTIVSMIGLYTELIKFRMKKQIQADVYETSKIQLKIADKERELGTITEVDYLDINLNLKNLEIDILTSEQEERLLLFKFARLLGQDPDAPVRRPSGTLNVEFQGFIPERPMEYWLKLIEEKNMEMIQKRFALSVQKQSLEDMKLGFLPNVTANFKFNVSGMEYPLSEPGFSLGLSFAFDVPTSPVTVDGSLGKNNPDERSAGFSVNTKVLDDLSGLYSEEVARIAFEKAGKEFADYTTDVRFKLKESLFDIDRGKKTLALLREKFSIETKKINVMKLKLELGQVKRIDYLTSMISLSKLTIEILGSVVELYNKEIALLRMCGVGGLYETHKNIIRN